jgi:hypothetical protein
MPPSVIFMLCNMFNERFHFYKIVFYYFPVCVDHVYDVPECGNDDYMAIYETIDRKRQEARNDFKAKSHSMEDLETPGSKSILKAPLFAHQFVQIHNNDLSYSYY